jgi:hypothetical protein
MGREDGPGSESGGNVGYGGGGSFGGGMDEGQSSVTADTYSGGGSSDGGRDRGGSGVGRQDSPFSESGGNVGYSPTNRATGPGADQYNAQQNLLDAIKRDIASGVNVRGRGYQTNLADRILGGKFGSPSNFGITSPTIGDRALSALGYDRSKSLMANVKAAAIPGQKTPLGALSLVPTIVGANPQLRAAVTIGNFLAGQQMSKDQKPEQEKSITDKIQEYTGRPDDAPAFTPSYPAGQNFGSRTTSGTQQVADAGITLDDVMNFRPQDITVTMPEMKMAPKQGPAVNDVLDYFGLPRSVDVPTPFGDINVGFPDRETKSGTATTPAGQFLQGYVPSQLPQGTQVAGLDTLIGTAKNIAKGVTQIPGGYQIGDKQYTGTYRENPSARTYTGSAQPYTKPFSAEALKQGISTLFN